MSMRHLMQYLNGAALASIWVFFEHIDKLNYINLQTFNKEIQMVQQQFIIAELSQDSSVITAHITVGNHSHSQAQKSIEQRFNPQRAGLNLEDEKERHNDIKIEDNFHEDMNPDGDASDDEEDILPQKIHDYEEHKGMMDSPALNLEDERPLESESDENMLDSDHLEAFKDGMHKEHLHELLNKDDDEPKRPSHHQEEEELFENSEQEILEQERRAMRDESQQMKIIDRSRHKETTEGDGSKLNTTNDDGSKMNKICFGVFASISHEFILKNTQKADEISLSLQSAFRVISLNRPEYRIILKTLLKCEGIKNYEQLGDNILEFINRIKAAAPEGATDKHFNLTYSDVQAIVKSIGYLTDKNWKEKSDYFANLKSSKLKEFESKFLHASAKQEIEDKKNEIEAKIDKMERKERVIVESHSTMKTLELYAIQRCLYDWYMLRKQQAKVQEVDVEQEIVAKSHQILHQLFKEKVRQAHTPQEEIQRTIDAKLDKVIAQFEKENDLNMSGFMRDSTRRFYKMFDVCKRIALVGPICSGKSTLLRIMSFVIKKMHEKTLNYSIISPKSFTYGELYGCSDRVQAYSSDIESRDSIYSIILDKYSQMTESQEEKIVKSIVIDANIEEVDSECTIQHGLRIQKTEELDNDLNKKFIRFPNGITLELPHDLYFFYETDTLQNASPRFISSVGVIMTNEKFISWREIIKRNVQIIVNQNASFFKMFSITQTNLLHDIEKIVVSIVNKFEAEYSELPLMWDKRMHIQNFFKVFKSYLNELKTVILRKVKRSPELAKDTIDFFSKGIAQTLNSFILISLIWSFSGILDVKNRRKFENVAGSVDIGYKINLVTSNKSESLSFFDLSFDFERMHWVTISDLEQYGNPVMIDKENLIVNTDDYLKYHNFVSFILKNANNTDFGCVIAGDTSTFKSTILKSISYKYASKKMWLPMSCYLTLPKLKSEIVKFAGGVKRKHDDTLILIDDLHLQSNINVDVLDYLRMWTKNRGHYNIKEKSFDSL